MYILNRRFICFIFSAFFLAPLGLKAQPQTHVYLRDILAKNQNPVFQQVLQNPRQYRLQIIYTQINRDKNNRPQFKEYYFHVDSSLYFNPASTVKLPVALLSLEKLNDLNIPGVNMETAMAFDSSYSNQKIMVADSSGMSGKPNIAQFIRRAMLVSENEPYNRMYEFVGQQQFNRRLHQMGYTHTRMAHRFIRLSEVENRNTNAIRFLDANGNILYSQAAAFNPDSLQRGGPEEFLGKGYMNARDSIIHEPFDFSMRNRISLGALNNILRATMFPASLPYHQRFRLTANDYRFMWQYMSQYAGETNYPKYDAEKYYDSYAKFFFMDSAHREIPANIRVFNKVGWAYGFLTDMSYVVDFENKVEFMLSATLYVNDDGILNDNEYDYKTIGHPFMYQLGQTIYQHELQRQRTYLPNLNVFKLNYEKRLPDNRPVLQSVDN